MDCESCENDINSGYKDQGIYIKEEKKLMTVVTMFWVAKWLVCAVFDGLIVARESVVPKIVQATSLLPTKPHP